MTQVGTGVVEVWRSEPVLPFHHGKEGVFVSAALCVPGCLAGKLLGCSSPHPHNIFINYLEKFGAILISL